MSTQNNNTITPYLHKIIYAVRQVSYLILEIRCEQKHIPLNNITNQNIIEIVDEIIPTFYDITESIAKTHSALIRQKVISILQQDFNIQNVKEN